MRIRSKQILIYVSKSGATINNMHQVEASENSLGQEKHSAEIINVEALNELPKGCCLLSDEDNGRGILAVGENIVDIVNTLGDRVPGSFREEVERQANYPKYLIGRVMSNYPLRPFNLIAEQLLERYSALCWFRGTEYFELDNGVPFPSKYYQHANGYLGDLEALSYASKPYRGKNTYPVLYIASLEGILEGISSGTIDIKSEQGFDVDIGIGDGDYESWAIKNWIICDLGVDGKDMDRAYEILRSKAIVVPRAYRV